MKKILLGMLLWQTLLANQSVGYAEAGSTYSLAQARSIVEVYLAALVQGDLASIRPLLGGTLLKEKERMLDDPHYSSKLSEIYSNATYEIISVMNAHGGNVAVDVRLMIDPTDYIDARFLVSEIDDASTQQSKYLITDEIN
jgi:hypothetical protein